MNKFDSWTRSWNGICFYVGDFPFLYLWYIRGFKKSVLLLPPFSSLCWPKSDHVSLQLTVSSVQPQTSCQAQLGSPPFLPPPWLCPHTTLDSSDPGAVFCLCGSENLKNRTCYSQHSEHLTQYLTQSRGPWNIYNRNQIHPVFDSFTRMFLGARISSPDAISHGKSNCLLPRWKYSALSN